jgi:hypothetical protein
MISLETDRLIIRNFSPDDWQELQEMAIQYQASEWARYEDPWPTSDKEVKGMAAWFAGGDDYLAMCLKATGAKSEKTGCTTSAMSFIPAMPDRATPRKAAAPRWAICSASWPPKASSPARIRTTSRALRCSSDWGCARSAEANGLYREQSGWQLTARRDDKDRLRSPQSWIA